MSLILHIDTAVTAASICLAENAQLIAEARNEQSRESAAWLQPAIGELFEKAGYRMDQLKAVAVSAGPGSYTGLRVGMASAKGLCYALQLPLITIGTLEMMTAAALKVHSGADLYCPMIDARRMEVFTGIYNRDMEPLLQPHNRILDANSFSEWLHTHRLCFFGNGSDKLKPLLGEGRADFAEVQAGAADLIDLAYEHFKAAKFADLAYSEPLYVKAFYTTKNIG